MFRTIKMLLLIVFTIISTLGLIISTLSYFGTMFVGDAALPKWIFGTLFGVPIVFIPAVAIAVEKTVRYKGERYKYGIRFWPAIRKIPKQFAIAIYIFALNLAIMILLNYFGHGKDSLVLSSGIMLFYYVPTIIYLSSFKNTNI